MYFSQSKKWVFHFGLLISTIFMGDVVGDAFSPNYSDKTNELIGYCAPYHGTVCKSFVSSSQVWYSNVSNRFMLFMKSMVK